MMIARVSMDAKVCWRADECQITDAIAQRDVKQMSAQEKWMKRYSEQHQNHIHDKTATDCNHWKQNKESQTHGCWKDK